MSVQNVKEKIQFDNYLLSFQLFFIVFLFYILHSFIYLRKDFYEVLIFRIMLYVLRLVSQFLLILYSFANPLYKYTQDCRGKMKILAISVGKSNEKNILK